MTKKSHNVEMTGENEIEEDFDNEEEQNGINNKYR